jgi:transglutaminase-like putative cysteine protease
MDRSVSCLLEADVEGVADVTLSVAVAADAGLAAENLEVSLGGAPVPTMELHDDHGTRLHHLTGVGPGRLRIDYAATVTGVSGPPPVSEVDLIRYVRPSRYCEADRLGAFARGEFAGLHGHDLLDAVSSWVGSRVAYIAGSSRPTDGAVTTLLSREGVCRDFAHLVIALLRACDVPARLVSVYAPGLAPMDFHAVAEAHVDGAWHALDATCLAPRTAMVRIATGRDAADTAFLSTTGDPVRMGPMQVMAVVDPGLPDDDLTLPARLG